MRRSDTVTPLRILSLKGDPADVYLRFIVNSFIILSKTPLPPFPFLRIPAIL